MPKSLRITKYLQFRNRLEKFFLSLHDKFSLKNKTRKMSYLKILGVFQIFEEEIVKFSVELFSKFNN